jgi:hypothetical protein
MNGPVTEPLLAVAVNPVRPLLSRHMCGSNAKINSGVAVQIDGSGVGKRGLSATGCGLDA